MRHLVCWVRRRQCTSPLLDSVKLDDPRSPSFGCSFGCRAEGLRLGYGVMMIANSTITTIPSSSNQRNNASKVNLSIVGDTGVGLQYPPINTSKIVFSVQTKASKCTQSRQACMLHALAWEAQVTTTYTRILLSTYPSTYLSSHGLQSPDVSRGQHRIFQRVAPIYG